MTENIDFDQLMEQQRQLLKEIQSEGPEAGTNSNHPDSHNTKTTKEAEPFVAYGWTFERATAAAAGGGTSQKTVSHGETKKSKKQRRQEREQAEEWISNWHYERVPPTSSSSAISHYPPRGGDQQDDNDDDDIEEELLMDHINSSGNRLSRSSDHSNRVTDDGSCHSSATPQWFFERVPATTANKKSKNDNDDHDYYDDNNVMDMMLGGDDIKLPSAADIPGLDDASVEPDGISLEDLIVDDDDDAIMGMGHHGAAGQDDDDDGDDMAMDEGCDGMGTPSSSMHASSLQPTGASAAVSQVLSPTSVLSGPSFTTPQRSVSASSAHSNGSHPSVPRLPCAEGMDDMFKSTLQKLSESMRRSAESRSSLTMKTPQVQEYERNLCVSQIVQSVQSSSRHVDTCLQMYQQQQQP